MNTIILEKKLYPDSILDRMLKRKNKNNAFPEINNLFVKKEPLSITLEEIHNILSEYKIRNFYKKHKHDCENIYKHFLTYFLKDKK